METLDHRTYPAKLWRTIKAIDGKSLPKAENEAITFYDSQVSSPKQIANYFRRQFTRLGNHTSSRETRLGPDKFSIFHLKNIGPKAIEYLTALFNYSITSCLIPVILKSSIVIHIPKPGKDSSLGTSYRPISILELHRRQTISYKLQRRKSKARIIHTGVPQGSKLSPTLFSFYIADMPRQTEPVRRICYADNTTVLSGVKLSEPDQKVNTNLTVIFRFLWENSLLISAPQSSVALFTPDPAQANTRPKIKIADPELPLAAAQRYEECI